MRDEVGKQEATTETNRFFENLVERKLKLSGRLILIVYQLNYQLLCVVECLRCSILSQPIGMSRTREPEIQLESLILAQNERWRRA